MKARIFAAFLFICMFLPAIGLYSWLQFKKAAVRKEIKWRMIEGIPKEELVLLSFTSDEIKTELNWKHSKEFEYKGEMYDIVSTEVLGDTILYWCWWDHEETRLNKKLNDIVSAAIGGNKQTNENQKRAQSFYKSLFLNDLFKWVLKNRSCEKLLFSYCVFNLQSHIIRPPVPPP